MAGDDKTIRIGADSASLKRSLRDVDALTAAFERLKKAGVRMPGMGAVGDLSSTAGAAKFGKEILNVSRNMDRLSDKARAFVKVMGDARVPVAIKALNKEYDEATKKLEKMARVWETMQRTRKVSPEYAARIASRVAETQASRQGAAREALQLGQPIAGTGGGWRGAARVGLGQIAGRMGLGTPVGAMAAAAGSMYVATSVAQGVHDRYAQQREAGVGAASVFNQRAIQILSGQGHREAYLRRLGVEREAQSDMRRQTPLALLGRGRIGAAMGVKSTAGALATDYGIAGGIGAIAGGIVGSALPVVGTAIGAAAGAALGSGAAAAYRFYQGGGVRGLFEDPEAARLQEQTGQYLRGREAAEKRKEVNMFIYDQYMDKSPAISQLQRLRGITNTGFQGGAGHMTNPLTGTRGIDPESGQPLLPGLGNYSFDRIVAAETAQGAVGARGIRGTEEMMRMQREHGIENAPAMSARLGLATNFGGNQERQFKEVLASAYAMGMDRSEMKVERESFVEAVVAASERTGRNTNLVADAAGIEAEQLRAGLGPKSTVNDIMAAAGAEGILKTMTGGEEGPAAALARRTTHQFLGSAPNKLSYAEQSYLSTIGASMISKDADAQGLLKKAYGLGDSDADKATLARKTRDLTQERAKDTFHILGWSDRKTDEYIRRSNLKAGDPEALTENERLGVRAEMWQSRSAFGKEGMREAGYALEQAGLMASGGGVTPVGKDQKSKRSGGRTGRVAGGGTIEYDAYYEKDEPSVWDKIKGRVMPVTGDEKVERERAAGEKTVLAEAGKDIKSIDASVEAGMKAAKSFKEIFAAASGPEGLTGITKSLDANLKTITAALSGLADAAGKYPGATPFKGKEPDQPEKTR